MNFSSLKSIIAAKLGRVSLRTVLVVPFVLQIVAAVSVVGYLSYRSGQNAVETLANKLIEEVGERIQDRLNTYLHIPHQVVAANHLAVKQGTIDPNNLEQLRQQLWQQITLNQSLATNFFWSEGGEAIGYGRILTQEFREKAEKLTGESLPMGTIYLFEVSKANLNQRKYYLVDERGKPKKLVYILADNFRKLPWYSYAKKAKKQTWTPIFIYRSTLSFGMQASRPIYNYKSQFQGVFTSSFSLGDISNFLNQLQFSPTGQAFIIDRSGYIIATSTLEKIYIKQPKDQIIRLSVINSQNSQMREIARELKKKFGNFLTLQTVQELSPIYKGQRQFVRIVPYRDEYGLDLLVVIVVPESDFMAEINYNKRLTIVLCIAALGVAIALGLFTANKITRRISQINRASQAMAAGKLERHLETKSRVQELSELAQSFNQMAEQLGDYFARIQLALQDSEEKFTTIFRTSPDPIAIVTLAEGRILEINNHFIDFFGYSRAECINRTVVELGVWSNFAERDRFRQRLQQKGRIYNQEVKFCLKSQEIRTVLISAKICNLKGQNCAIIAIKDISDRKQAELALQESEQRLEAILDSAPFAIFIKDLQGRYIRVNPAYEQMTNLTREQLLGITDNDLLPPDFAQMCWESDQLVLTEKQTIHFEEFVPFPNKTRYLLATKFPLLDLGGNPYAVCGIAVDISDRKQAEEALCQSEKRFRSLFENSPVAYYALDEQGRYIDVNAELCHLLGYTREEIIGKSGSEFWSKETKDFFPKQFACFKSDGITRRELQLVRKDAELITVLLEGRIQHDTNGQFVKTHCILYNITERKRMEEALRQTKAKLRQANRELAKLVNVDALTQVANRRRFASHLQKEWGRLRREQKPLSLIVFDVDYFKRYNDRYGHQEGDLCLVKIAQAAQQVVHRPRDLVARYGGEEFAVILPNTSPEGAMVVADRIRAAIHALAIPHAESDVNDKVTVSLGIASLIPAAEKLPEQLVAQADTALYLAKQQGRDRFAIFSQ